MPPKKGKKGKKGPPESGWMPGFMTKGNYGIVIAFSIMFIISN